MKLAAFAVLALLAGVTLLWAQYDNCQGFISVSCCCSNNCCWDIEEGEVELLPDDRYRVRATGQVIKRTGWSPTGRYHRCACDYDQESGKWIRHQGANTRCLYVPPPSS